MDISPEAPLIHPKPITFRLRLIMVRVRGKVLGFSSSRVMVKDSVRVSVKVGVSVQCFIYTPRGFTPSHLKTPPGYTLPALPLAGSL